MRPHEIKGRLIMKYGSMGKAAQELGTDQPKLAQCLSQFRPFYDLRKKIAKALNTPEHIVFSEYATKQPPRPKSRVAA